MSFHEVRFPTAIALGSISSLRRQTDIVVLGSGHEERNTRWADSRRSYNAGYGIKTLDALYEVVAFYEARRGQLHGFRWKDGLDFNSSSPQSVHTASDQLIGTGDGATSQFQLVKMYGDTQANWQRTITKPVAGSVLVSVDGVTQNQGSDFELDVTTGLVTFLPSTIPGQGQEIRAGFEFDVPVRFDTDRLDINLEAFGAGQIPTIPLVEVRI